MGLCGYSQCCGTHVSCLYSHIKGKVFVLLANESSDVSQVLHMHYNGLRELYSFIINKVEVCYDHVQD